MDKAQALHQFWSGFGLPAYDESTLPDDAVMPYITYTVETDSLGAALALTASLYYRSFSWVEISRKAEEIASAIVNMAPPTIAFDRGRLYLTKGSPFAVRLQEADDAVRRIDLNITAEFFSAV